MMSDDRNTAATARPYGYPHSLTWKASGTTHKSPHAQRRRSLITPNRTFKMACGPTLVQVVGSSLLIGTRFRPPGHRIGHRLGEAKNVPGEKSSLLGRWAIGGLKGE